MGIGDEILRKQEIYFSVSLGNMWPLLRHFRCANHFAKRFKAVHSRFQTKFIESWAYDKNFVIFLGANGLA
jgi:hypothetical protein